MSDALQATIGSLGDRAVLLTLHGDREGCNRGIVRLSAILSAECREESPRTIVDVVPALVSLAVFFDPRLVSARTIERRLLALADGLTDPGPDSAARLHVIPAWYDGPDLAEVARLVRLDPDEIVRRHTDREYRVRFLGFAPGFAYLGPLPPSLVVPRRSEPRRRVPAGSVAIAGDQTAVYPLDTPGGWQLIGRTTLRPFDPSRSPPSQFAAGDRVRFVRVAS
jgi:KipI family sensor histidine kinase inhibitor